MEKKTALITGSTGGLGKAFVELHAKSGGDVILVGRNEQKLEVQVDYLINNAGLGGQGSFDPDFVKRGSGKILNVSSTAALLPGPLQAEYYATKAYVTSLSNAIWQELKGTGVTCTVLMPGAMNTGFASAGGLENTKLFAKPSGSVEKVAKAGYEGMLKGKLSVFAGLPGWQSPFVSLMPLMPKKLMMRFIADQQTNSGVIICALYFFVTFLVKNSK